MFQLIQSTKKKNGTKISFITNTDKIFLSIIPFTINEKNRLWRNKKNKYIKKNEIKLDNQIINKKEKLEIIKENTIKTNKVKNLIKTKIHNVMRI